MPKSSMHSAPEVCILFVVLRVLEISASAGGSLGETLIKRRSVNKQEPQPRDVQLLYQALCMHILMV
jgi:hypothetical protein